MFNIQYSTIDSLRVIKLSFFSGCSVPFQSLDLPMAWSSQPLYEWMIHYPLSSQYQGDPVLLLSQVQSCRVRKMETASFLLPSESSLLGGKDKDGMEGRCLSSSLKEVLQSRNLQCLGLGDWGSFIQQMASYYYFVLNWPWRPEGLWGCKARVKDV